MPSWDVLSGWVMLAGVVGGFWLAKRAARNKAANLRAEGRAEARAELAAQLSNTVIVGSDLRRTDVRLDSTDDGSTDDRAVIESWLDGSPGRHSVRGAAAHVLGRGAPVVSPFDRHGAVRPGARSMSANELSDEVQ